MTSSTPSSKPIFDPMVGGTLGRYHLQECIGRGGMGTVYRAEQMPLGRVVAVKVIHPTLVSDRKAVSRFLREAKIAGQLTNPHTVTVFDFGSAGEHLYIAMELLSGESLRERLDRGPLEPSRAAEIAAQICRSLVEAHRKGIIHRDLKPDNIFLTVADNGALLAKVLDYGLARMVSNDEKPLALHTILTQHGAIVGTPSYMSPEQARGRKLDMQTDLYSLGIVLFEMLTGVLPFSDEDAVLVLGKHIRDPVPRLAQLGEPREHPGALQVLIDRLLEKEPAKRPPGAGAVYEELGAFLASSTQGSDRPAPSARAPGPSSGGRPSPGTSGVRRLAGAESGQVLTEDDQGRASELAGAGAGVVRKARTPRSVETPTERFIGGLERLIARAPGLPDDDLSHPATGSEPPATTGQGAGRRSVRVLAIGGVALCAGLLAVWFASRPSPPSVVVAREEEAPADRPRRSAMPAEPAMPVPVRPEIPSDSRVSPAPDDGQPVRSDAAPPETPRPGSVPEAPEGWTLRAPAQWTGWWASSRGLLELRQQGSKVTGSFGGYGRLHGSVEGAELSTEWRRGSENGRARLRSYQDARGEIHLLGSWGVGTSSEGQVWRANPRAAARRVPSKRTPNGLVVPIDQIFGGGR